MGLYKAYKTDNDKEIKGVPIELTEAPNADETVPTFYLSRMGRSNKDYAKAMERTARPFRRKQQLGTMTNEESDGILMDVFCSTVLKGWDNVQDENDNNIPFSAKAAEKLFEDLPDLYQRLLDEASEVTNFAVAGREDEAKN